MTSSADRSAHGFIKPPRLQPRDVIGVVAPSSPQRDDQRLRNGIAYFESLGYRVRTGKHLWDRYGYLAGSDESRLDDLNGMLRDESVRMVIAGRGGYGITRILQGVDFEALRRDPKIVVGFSDVTALHCAILGTAGVVGFAGPMAGVDFAEVDGIDALTEASFWNAVTSDAPARVLAAPGAKTRSEYPGVAEGWLLPVNLTMLASICGTPYLPAPDGAVLLIEEIGEEAYRVDRLLSQLWNAGILRRVAGIALGTFTDAEPHRVAVESLPLSDVFNHWIGRAGVPAVSGVAFGHVRTKHTMPVGVLARIDGTNGTLELLEGGVR